MFIKETTYLLILQSYLGTVGRL